MAAAGDLEGAAASYRHASEAMTDDGHALLQYVQVSKQMCAWRQAVPHSEAVLERARNGNLNGPPYPILAIA